MNLRLCLKVTKDHTHRYILRCILRVLRHLIELYASFDLFQKTQQYGTCRLNVIRFAYYFEYSRSFEMRSNLLNHSGSSGNGCFWFFSLGCEWNLISQHKWLQIPQHSLSTHLLMSILGRGFSAAWILSNYFNCWAQHHVLIFQYKPPCCYHTWFTKSNLLYSTSLIDYCNISWVFK